MVCQVAIFKKNTDPSIDAMQVMKQRIDSAEGRRRYSQRIGTLEPVFDNLRHNKCLGIRLRNDFRIRVVSLASIP